MGAATFELIAAELEDIMVYSEPEIASRLGPVAGTCRSMAGRLAMSMQNSICSGIYNVSRSKLSGSAVAHADGKFFELFPLGTDPSLAATAIDQAINHGRTEDKRIKDKFQSSGGGSSSSGGGGGGGGGSGRYGPGRG